MPLLPGTPTAVPTRSSASSSSVIVDADHQHIAVDQGDIDSFQLPPHSSARTADDDGHFPQAAEYYPQMNIGFGSQPYRDIGSADDVQPHLEGKDLDITIRMLLLIVSGQYRL